MFENNKTSPRKKKKRRQDLQIENTNMNAQKN